MFTKLFPVKKGFKPHTASFCGHFIPRQEEVVTAFSTHRRLCLPAGQSAFCHACQADVAIQCYRCTKAIFPGDPISLDIRYPFTIHDDHTIFEVDGVSCVAACGRLGCVASLAHYQGRWIVDADMAHLPVGGIVLARAPRLFGEPKLNERQRLPKVESPAFYAQEPAMDLPDNVVLMPRRAA